MDKLYPRSNDNQTVYLKSLSGISFVYSNR